MKVPPRQDRYTWDESNMLIACAAAGRSPDPHTQVGAYICTNKYRPISTGYNGTARGINPETISWAKEAEKEVDTKYPYVVHAELNAILNAGGQQTAGGILYTTLFPCNGCANAIIQAGIKEVVYLSDKYKDKWWTQLADNLFQQRGIIVRQFKLQKKTPQWIESYLDNIARDNGW